MITSIYHLLQETANVYKDQVAARFYKDNSWASYTWSELLERVDQLSSGLVQLGINPNDRVAIYAKTRVEWVIFDLAILAAGGVTVPIYQSSSHDDTVFILRDSKAKLVFADDDEILTKARKAVLEVSFVQTLVTMSEQVKRTSKVTEVKLDDLFDKSMKNAAIIQERMAQVSEENVATLVYTSGTTGVPKGAMLTHDNLLYEARAIEKFGIVNSQDVQLLFLPLAHVFAKVLEMAWLKTAHTLVFAQSIEKAIDNMKEVRPTIMASVPRVYEKIYAKILAGVENSPGFKGALGRWALKHGDRITQEERRGKKPNGLGWSLAKKLVFSKIEGKLKELFGGRLKYFISGGAVLSPNIAFFFKHSGITILEAYGLTETTAGTCVNLPTHNRIGTVGKPVPGTELKIADDGEICIRGRGVFKGYWNNQEETDKVLTSDGWFKTGDIGLLDQAGFLRITDRKKEIIVTAGGKNIAPQKVENIIKSYLPLVGHVVVYGDRRPYLVALFVLDEQNVEAFAKRKSIKKKIAEFKSSKALKKELTRELKSANALLAPFEQVKKFAVLEHDFVIGDELTPTLKVKRHHVYEKYKQTISNLYS